MSYLLNNLQQLLSNYIHNKNSLTLSQKKILCALFSIGRDGETVNCAQMYYLSPAKYSIIREQCDINNVDPASKINTCKKPVYVILNEIESNISINELEQLDHRDKSINITFIREGINVLSNFPTI